jgi:drug/metabolite transporter (DMT)-like permease
VLVVATVIASLLSSLALVVQSRDPQNVPLGASFRWSMLRHLLLRRRWLIGLAMACVGSLLQILALTELPIAFVQPTVAGGIIVVPFADGLINRRRPSVAVLAMTGVLVGSVIVLGHNVSGHSSDVPRSALVPLIGIPMLAIIAARIAGRVRPVPGPAFALLAGACFASSALLSKAVATTGFLGGAFVIAAVVMVAFAVLGQLAQASALQRVSASTVAPLVLVIATAVPVVIARVFLDETWPHSVRTPVALGVAVLMAALIAHQSRQRPATAQLL